MTKKAAVTLAGMFVFFYIFNYLTPMAYGDDYVYSFIWQGHSEYEPLVDPALRVSSWSDLAVSLKLHYFTWSGRTVGHMLTQLFLWLGKDVFNIFNAFISVLLLVEIYWCVNKGVVTLNLKLNRVCWVFFAVWAFTPGFSPVFFWLTGACNYLWMAVFLLAFLIPYIRKFYFFEEQIAFNGWFKAGMFFLGIIAGWSNENSICWIASFLFLFLYCNRQRKDFESWMAWGLTGLLLGYALLMLSPGNVVRLHAEVGTTYSWFNLNFFKEKFVIFLASLFFQFLLWYFCLRSVFMLRAKAMQNELLKKEQLLVKVLCFVSFCMTSVMVFSPGFPPRSAFPGTVQLVIAAGILLRVEQEFDIAIIKNNAKKFLFAVGLTYFIITSATTFYGFYDYHIQIDNMLSFVKNSEKAKNEIVTVPALVPVSEALANASGLHMPYYKMSEDDKDWRNVAFAKYYGIKGIRTVDKNKENQK